MNVASSLAEGFTILTWWTAFHSSSEFLISSSSKEWKVASTLLAGAASGALLTGLSLQIKNVRLWPETLEERRIVSRGHYQATAIRMAASHALFFTVYTGLSDGVYNARIKSGRMDFTRDWQDATNDFLTGFVSGLCFRAGSMGWNFGNVQIPLTAKMVALTGVKMGVACSVLNSVDDYARKEISILGRKYQIGQSDAVAVSKPE